MNAKDTTKMAKQISFFKESLYKVGETFSHGVEEGWEEIYLAYFVSADGNKDNLLAAALMKSPERVVDYSKEERWTLEYFKARILLEDFWMESMLMDKGWYRVLFSLSRFGEMKMFFGETPLGNLDDLGGLSLDFWTRFLREAKDPLPVVR
ncbi:MAG: hypothetical protein IIZ39_13155 [Blautia sp.]|nr:hypothetical protein [Blautia sp.]